MIININFKEYFLIIKNKIINIYNLFLSFINIIIIVKYLSYFLLIC